MKTRRALTIIEVLAILMVAAILIALTPALGQVASSSKLTKEGVQVCRIHQAWLTFSQDFGGTLPVPGLVRRLPDPQLGLAPDLLRGGKGKGALGSHRAPKSNPVPVNSLVLLHSIDTSLLSSLPVL